MKKLCNTQQKNTRTNLKITSNENYKATVAKKLKRRLKNGDNREWLKNKHIAAMSVFLLNFDPVRELLENLYSGNNRGQTPQDPQAILRSLLLMHSLKETGITKWVKETRSNSMLRLFCGFADEKTPGVGTYYDFKKRLENGVFTTKYQHIRALPSEIRIARSKNCEQPRKSMPEDKTVVKEPVVKTRKEKIIASEQDPLPNDFETVLNQILYLVAVAPSADKGIINDINNLTTAIDGSTIASGASYEGKRMCDCKQQGIYKCDCLRKFADADARWGFDNREKTFVWGYRYLQMVCADNRHDLPIYLTIAPANTHEPLMAIDAIDRFDKLSQKLKSSAKIARASFDALFDQYHFYLYLVHKKIKYVIPYATQPKSPVVKGELLLDDKGVPLCEGGLAMRRLGKNRQNREVFGCPVKRLARKDGGFHVVVHREECPLAALCQPDTKHGPIVSVPHDIDPRIHPEIRRGSKEYKQLSRMRSCTERSNAFKKNVCGMNRRTTRSMSYAYIRLALISILEHSRVWARKTFENIDLANADWLAIFS